MKPDEAYSELKQIQTGVSQCIVLGTGPYPLSTSDILKLTFNTIMTFADDTAIMASGTVDGEEHETTSNY